MAEGTDRKMRAHTPSAIGSIREYGSSVGVGVADSALTRIDITRPPGEAAVL